MRAAPRSHRVASRPAASAQYVANKLAGAPVHTLPGGRAVVPLLHPQHHSLPFALTVELHAAPRQPAAAPAPAPAGSPDPSLFALHYVLAGSGQLARQGSSSAEPLQAGDAVLMHAGAAAVGADPASTAETAASSSSGLGPYQMAELVAYLPQELFDQAQQGQQWKQAAQQQPSAFTLPLLQQSSSSSSSSSGSGSGSGSGSSEDALRLSEELAAALLAGARDTARQAANAAGSRPSLATQQQPAAADGSRQGAGVLQRLQAAAASLTDWWGAQQGRTCPVTKRTLGELTAFQLPNQTNRLAVQFDPFSRPQVPFISGIEVFEAGHRTTPHVHPHAHELFFILAGEGTGFCGAERFPVRAGDVVVFRPGAVHGIDNGPDSRMYCLELMVPNEEFAEYVRAGTDTGRLAADDMCVLASIGCR